MLSIKYISTINMYFLYRYAVLERRANHEYQQTANKWLTSGGRLNKKDRLTGYGDPHVKDKTSYRPSYL